MFTAFSSPSSLLSDWTECSVKDVSLWNCEVLQDGSFLCGSVLSFQSNLGLAVVLNSFSCYWSFFFYFFAYLLLILPLIHGNDTGFFSLPVLCHQERQVETCRLRASAFPFGVLRIFKNSVIFSSVFDPSSVTLVSSESNFPLSLLSSCAIFYLLIRI